MLIVLVGIWLIVANVLMIVFAQRLKEQPQDHSKYGTHIVVLSILGGLNVITLIGGIIAMTYQPAHQTCQSYQSSYPPAILKPELTANRCSNNKILLSM